LFWRGLILRVHRITAHCRLLMLLMTRVWLVTILHVHWRAMNVLSLAWFRFLTSVTMCAACEVLVLACLADPVGGILVDLSVTLLMASRIV